MTEQRRITDELRREAQGRLRYDYTTEHAKHLLAIADRIDAAHEEALSKVYMDMSDSEWVRLPKDADGVPIHLGDEVYQVEGGWVYTIESITFYPDNTTVTFSCKHGYGCDSSNNVRHYHTPTVEDVLREMYMELDEVTALYVGEAIDSDERDSDDRQAQAGRRWEGAVMGEQQWRNEPATERQLAYIAEMQEFSPYPIERFDGTTKGDASDYINRWKEMSHESTWAIEHGYE